MSACGIAGDMHKSRKAYAEYMSEAMISQRKMKSKDKIIWKRMERGWVHGCTEFRDDMIDLCVNQILQ